MDPLTVAIGRVIRARRRAMRLSLRELGHRATVSYNTVKNVELGVRRVRIDILARIAHALGTSLAELVREAERGLS